MYVLDLFSGIGGFSLGLERAGFKTAAFCEIDPYCRAVLRKHWPSVPCFEDIRTLDQAALEARGIPAIDVICGGYPCQPFSMAGKRRGTSDDRHLWPEMFRLIQELRPTWVIGENVAGHITMGLDETLSDLESAGYSARTLLIPALGIDAPHRRDRVWIVAHCDSQRCDEGWPPGEIWERRRPETLGVCGALADASSGREQSSGAQCDVGRLQAQILRTGRYSVNWPAEPAVGRVAHGIPCRVDRIRALGNSVVPVIPEIIGRAIKESMMA